MAKRTHTQALAPRAVSSPWLEPDSVFIQLKAAESWPALGSSHVFDLDIRDYNLWRLVMTPVILILYDASPRRAYWLHVQGYFRKAAARQPKKGAKTVRAWVPRRQLVNGRAVATWRDLKWEARGRVIGAES